MACGGYGRHDNSRWHLRLTISIIRFTKGGKIGHNYKLDVKLIGYGLRFNKFISYYNWLFVILGYTLILNDYL